MSAVPAETRYRAIEAMNGTTNVEYLTTLAEGTSGGLVDERTDGRAVISTDGCPVKLTELAGE